MIIFASYSIFWLWDRIKSRGYKKIAAFIICFVVIFWIANMQLYSDVTSGRWVWLGMMSSQAGKLDESMEYYNKALIADPSDIRATQLIAGLYFRKDELQQAKQWFEKSLAMSPTIEAYSSLGSIYLRLNEYEKARMDYEKALEMNPKLSSALDGLACVEFVKGNNKKSYDLWMESLKYENDFNSKNRINNNIALAKKSNNEFAGLFVK